MNISKPLLSALVIGLALLPVPEAWSATQSVTANIRFDTPLTVTKNQDIDFGTVTAGVADTYTISPAGATSHTGSGAYLFGTTQAANITISGSTTQTLNISAGGFTASAHVTPSNATCKYGAAAAGSCTIPAAAAPGASTTLLVGVDAVATAATTAGTAEAPSFTLTIVYN